MMTLLSFVRGSFIGEFVNLEMGIEQFGFRLK